MKFLSENFLNSRQFLPYLRPYQTFLPKSLQGRYDREYLSREGATSSSSSSAEEEHRWTVDVLSQTLPELSLVIDLTATDRYYNPRNMQLKHVKIKTEGHVVPNKTVIKRFFKEVDRALNVDKEALIGVHCTHGVNRTGYLICRYLIQKLKWEPEKAIQEFADCRGHAIERENYLQSLKSVRSAENELSKSPKCDEDSASPERSEKRSSKRRTRHRRERRRDRERSEYEKNDRDRYERRERREYEDRYERSDYYEPKYRSYPQRSERYDRSRTSNYRQSRYENVDRDTKSPRKDSYRDDHGF